MDETDHPRGQPENAGEFAKQEREGSKNHRLLSRRYSDKIVEALRKKHVDQKVVAAANEASNKFPANKRFYVYVHYRKDGEPLYVGKGQGTRVDEHKFEEGETESVQVAVGLTEIQAYDLEKELIGNIGRATKGEGPLVNIM